MLGEEPPVVWETNPQRVSEGAVGYRVCTPR